eukprot:14683229-Ditylum_brightwellii.AAC.1
MAYAASPTKQTNNMDTTDIKTPTFKADPASYNPNPIALTIAPPTQHANLLTHHLTADPPSTKPDTPTPTPQPTPKPASSANFFVTAFSSASLQHYQTGPPTEAKSKWVATDNAKTNLKDSLDHSHFSGGHVFCLQSSAHDDTMPSFDSAPTKKLIRDVSTLFCKQHIPILHV